MLGWQVLILLADCDANPPPTEYSTRFATALTKLLESKGVINVKTQFMSGLYSPGCEGCQAVHGHFQRILQDLTLAELISINTKKYGEAEAKSIQQKYMLDVLRPALTIGAVLRLRHNLPSPKCAVIVGSDEKDQWIRAHEVPGGQGVIGALFNPVLMKGPNQAKHSKRWPSWYSWEQLLAEMEGSNLAQWLTQLHVFLSQFPSSKVSINGKEVPPSAWKNGAPFDVVNNEELARYAFQHHLSPT
jgi:hypothetical protein